MSMLGLEARSAMHNPPEYQALCLKGREGLPGLLLFGALILPTLLVGPRYAADLTGRAAGIGRDLRRFSERREAMSSFSGG